MVILQKLFSSVQEAKRVGEPHMDAPSQTQNSPGKFGLEVKSKGGQGSGFVFCLVEVCATLHTGKQTQLRGLHLVTVALSFIPPRNVPHSKAGHFWAGSSHAILCPLHRRYSVNSTQPHIPSLVRLPSSGGHCWPWSILLF